MDFQTNTEYYKDSFSLIDQWAVLQGKKINDGLVCEFLNIGGSVLDTNIKHGG